VGIYHRLLAMFPMLQAMFLVLLAVLLFFIVDHLWAWLACSQLLLLPQAVIYEVGSSFYNYFW
jgi:predicted membrane channel-forming protein YqfA (hemolysin III family)